MLKRDSNINLDFEPEIPCKNGNVIDTLFEGQGQNMLKLHKFVK